MTQSWHSLAQGDPTACVSVSNAVSQASKDEITGTPDIAPHIIYEHVQAHIRQCEIDTAVHTLQRHGWFWENFDPGRSGLVPGPRDKQGW